LQAIVSIPQYAKLEFGHSNPKTSSSSQSYLW
jgi:hypothetical protein